jgi:hypothetical protein
MFALMWHIEDFEDGLVIRCSRCWPTTSSLDPLVIAEVARANTIASVYKQPLQNHCPDCYGTTFEGGYKALIIRPGIFTDTDESETDTARGVVHANDVDIESTPDFMVRTGDFVFRANGDRYYIRAPQKITLRTGLGAPLQSKAAIAYNQAHCSVEDEASVAYDIGPDETTLLSILSTASHWPADFSAFEVIRGPLISDDD